VNIISNLRETIIKENIPFNVIVPVVQQSTPTDPNKPVTIEGLARTTDMSISHHLTTENCIQSMKDQITNAAKAEQPIPSFLDHDPNKIIGNITGVKDSKTTELWPITELLPLSGNQQVDAPVQQVQHWIDNNIRLGMSISGLMTDSKFIEDMDTENWWIEINDIQLMENSITPIPAQEETQGTVAIKNSCKYGFCEQLGPQIKEYLKLTNPMITEQIDRIEEAKKSDYVVNQTCDDNAVKQIKAGNVDNGTWSKPNASDFSSIDDYIKIALAKHPDGDPKLAGTYGFEIGKSNGKISRQGVISAKTMAAGGRSTAGKNTAIYNAADKLLQLIDGSDDGKQEDSVKTDNQNIGGDIMEEDKRFKKLEQNTEFVMNYIQDQQEKEAQAALEQDKQSAVDKALKEEREKHKEELKTLKESYEKGAKEAVQEVLKEVLGDKKTVKQNSRHPEQQKSQENFIAQGLIKPAGVNLKGIPGYENITLEENTDKTITQQVSEQLPMNQRLKSVLYRPAVVRGKVLENAGQTAEEFLDTIAKNQ
jgi:hypothetical protein